MIPQKGVTKQSKYEPYQKPEDVTVPNTLKQPPVGSPEANPEEKVVDVSEAKSH